MSISDQCSSRYQAVHHGGPRTADKIKLIVIHSTEGPSADSAARWFTNPASGGSANLVIDDDDCFRTVADLIIPYAAPGANTSGFHVEIAGYAAWEQDRWLGYKQRLHRAAYKAATRCVQYKIPVRWIGPTRVRAGSKGLCTHATISLAYPNQARKNGWHTDPGKGFPKAYFLERVQKYYDDLVGT